MKLFDKLIKRKEKQGQETLDLLERLDKKGIVYTLVRNDEGYTITYLDVFDCVKYIVNKKDNYYKLNGNSMTEFEIEELLSTQSALDEELNFLLYKAGNDKLTQIYDYFKKIEPESSISPKLEITKGKELSLSLSLSNQDDKPFSTAHIENNKTLIYDKTNEKISQNELVVEMIRDAESKYPFLVDFSSVTFPDDSSITDSIKTYMVNQGLLKRLNQIENIETKIIENKRNSTIFIIFKNGAALEYMTATKQNKKGKYLIIDVDEDITLEDNKEYATVQKILNIPSYLRDKPNNIIAQIKKSHKN